MLVFDGVSTAGSARGSPTPSLLDSPTLARVERALLRHEGGKSSLRHAACCQSLLNSNSNSLVPGLEGSEAIKRGLMWQQRDRLFSRWKERYFILTRDYLHCFKRATGAGADRISQMGAFLFKVKLVGVEQVVWLNRRNYSAVALEVATEGRLLLRAHIGLEDWFELLEECMLSSKERRKALRISRDASFQANSQHSYNSVNSSLEEWLGHARRKIAGLQENLNSDTVPNLQTPNSSRPQSLAPSLQTSNPSRPQSMAPSLPIPNRSRPQSMALELQTPNRSRPQSMALELQIPNRSRPQSMVLELQTPNRSRPQSMAPELQTPNRSRPQSKVPRVSHSYLDKKYEKRDQDENHEEEQEQWYSRRRTNNYEDNNTLMVTDLDEDLKGTLASFGAEKWACNGPQHSYRLNSDVFFMSPPGSVRIPCDRVLGRPVLTPAGSFRSPGLFKPYTPEVAPAARHRDRSHSEVPHKWRAEERGQNYIVHTTEV